MLSRIRLSVKNEVTHQYCSHLKYCISIPSVKPVFHYWSVNNNHHQPITTKLEYFTIAIQSNRNRSCKESTKKNISQTTKCTITTTSRVMMESSPSMPSFPSSSNNKSNNNNISPHSAHLPLSAKSSSCSYQSYRRSSLVPVAVVAAGPLSLSALILTDKQFHPDRFTALLEGTDDKKNDFLKRLQNLQAAAHQMSGFFHEYDYEGVPHNGFRSFVKLLMMYLDNVEKLLNDQMSVRFTTSSSTRKTNRALKEYEAASHLLIHQVKVLGMIRQRDLRNKKRKESEVVFNGSEQVSPEENNAVDARESINTDEIMVDVKTKESAKESAKESSHDNPEPKNSMAASVNLLSDEQIAIFFEMLAVDHNLLLPFFSSDLRNFWLHPHSRRIMDVFLTRTISKLVPFHTSLWMNLFDSEGKKKTAINYTLNATICDQMKVWSLMEDNLMKALTAIKFIGSSGRVDQFTLGRQLQIMFGKDGKLSFDSSSQQLCHYPLQGMLINYNVKKSNEPQESLIFHCHGGGFVCMTPKGHEPYLRFWAQQTKTPVLCVNYGKAPLNPYPCGLQDLLDAFLFITSGRQEVLDILGFHPKNIIVTGDSAGGNLALTLTLALAAVKNNVNASQILPRAIFTQYPCGDPSVTVNASRTFISFDPLLTPACVFTIGSAYSGVDQMKMMESEELQKMMESEELHKIVNGSRNITEADDPKVSGNKISPENEVTKETDSKDSSSVKEDEHSNTNTEDSLTEVSNNLVSTQHSSSNDDDSVSKSPTAKSPPPSSMNSESSQLPWFRRSREEVISIASKVAMKSSDPFFNPLSCDKIPSFLIDNIPLLIQACEFDPLLDDSIAIARWYASQGGSVVLDVVEGVQHGFMIAIGHKSLQPAVDVSVTRIKQGLGLLPLLGLKSRTNRQEEEETQQTEKTESNSESMQEVQNS